MHKSQMIQGEARRQRGASRRRMTSDADGPRGPSCPGRGLPRRGGARPGRVLRACSRRSRTADEPSGPSSRPSSAAPPGGTRRSCTAAVRAADRRPRRSAARGRHAVPDRVLADLPGAAVRIGTLEADHAMVGLNQRLEDEPAFAPTTRRATSGTSRSATSSVGRCPATPGAGGMPRTSSASTSMPATPRHRRQPGREWTVEHARPCRVPARASTRTGRVRWTRLRTRLSSRRTRDGSSPGRCGRLRHELDAAARGRRIGADVRRTDGSPGSSAGVDARGHLDDGGAGSGRWTCDRGLPRRCGRRGVDGDVRIAATSAVRDAADREPFFDGVRRVTGVDAEVLTGDEEARLSFLGAVGAVDVPRPAARDGHRRRVDRADRR
jgi:hypothetical protein